MLCGAIAIAITGAGCSPPADDWAASAEAFVDDLHIAYGAGFTNVAQFYSENARVDDQFPDSFQGAGRAVIAQWQRDCWQPDACEGGDPRDYTVLTADEPVYLATGAALDPTWIHADPYIVRGAHVHRVGPEGISSHTWLASVKTADRYLGVWTSRTDPFADAYLDAWGGADPAAVGALYAPGAVLEDSVLGIRLEGPGPISGASGSAPERGGLSGASLHEIIDGFGRAAYLHLGGPESRDVLGMAVLVDVPGVQPCTWSVGALVTYDDAGLIVREERFHRVDSARACIDRDSLPSGWWDTVPTPDPRAYTPTGTVAVGGSRRTALWNGTAQREALLDWSLDRFTAAGLPPVAATTATFAPPSTDPWTEHGFVRTALDVVLPSTADGCAPEGCDTWPAQVRAQALASLAGAWLGDPAREYVMVGFAEQHDLVWPAAGDPRSETALDRAAATVAWGLMDDDSATPQVLSSSACDELVADFVALTQAAPLRPPCAS